MTVARALAYWPLFAVALLTFFGAPGIIGGALIVAMVRHTGGAIDGRMVMLAGFAAGFGGWMLVLLTHATIDTPFGLLVLSLFVHASLSASIRWAGHFIRGGVYTEAGLAVLLAVVVTVLAPYAMWRLGASEGSEIFGTLAAATLVSGIGLGVAASSPSPSLRRRVGEWGLGAPLLLSLAAVGLYAYRTALSGVPRGAQAIDDRHAIWAIGMLALSVLFALVALQRVLVFARLGRAPELHLPTEAGQPARVVRADGSTIKVHIDASTVSEEDRVLTLLAYQLGQTAESAYRSNAQRVTADAVFRGSRRAAQRRAVSSGLGWLGWAAFTAATASFGL